MYVCAYRTAKWAANILFKEMLNYQIYVYVFLG